MRRQIALPRGRILTCHFTQCRNVSGKPFKLGFHDIIRTIGRDNPTVPVGRLNDLVPDPRINRTFSGAQGLDPKAVEQLPGSEVILRKTVGNMVIKDSALAAENAGTNPNTYSKL